MVYTGKATIVNKPRELIFAGLSDLSALGSRIDELPEEVRAQMGTVNFPDAETLAFTAPGVGEMKFRIIDRMAPSQVKFLADTGLMPIYVTINLAEEGTEATAVSAAIEADIPMMLRPLVGSKLQEAADKFGEMFGKLNA